MLPPEATFDDYLATSVPADEVESTPIDMSLASMQDAGSKPSDKSAPSEVLSQQAHCVCCVRTFLFAGNKPKWATSGPDSA